MLCLSAPEGEDISPSSAEGRELTDLEDPAPEGQLPLSPLQPSSLPPAWLPTKASYPSVCRVFSVAVIKFLLKAIFEGKGFFGLHLASITEECQDRNSRQGPGCRNHEEYYLLASLRSLTPA